MCDGSLNEPPPKDFLIARLADALSARAERVTTLEEENARLREALEPFAKIAPDDASDPLHGITYGDLRRARAALKGSTP
jgi:hypothetical protein